MKRRKKNTFLLLRSWPISHSIKEKLVISLETSFAFKITIYISLFTFIVVLCITIFFFFFFFIYCIHSIHNTCMWIRLLLFISFVSIALVVVVRLLVRSSRAYEICAVIFFSYSVFFLRNKHTKIPDVLKSALGESIQQTEKMIKLFMSDVIARVCVLFPCPMLLSVDVLFLVYLFIYFFCSFARLLHSSSISPYTYVCAKREKKAFSVIPIKHIYKIYGSWSTIAERSAFVAKVLWNRQQNRFILRQRRGRRRRSSRKRK